MNAGAGVSGPGGGAGGGTDGPSAVVSFADGARVKTVRHYHGDLTAPPELSKLEDEIDAIVHVEQWIGTSEERSKNAAQWGR